MHHEEKPNTAPGCSVPGRESMTVHELGHIVLYVRDLERSRRFYGEVLGWKSLPAPADFPGALFSSGRTHHELLLLEVGPGAAPIPAGRRIRLDHVGREVGETGGGGRSV